MARPADDPTEVPQDQPPRSVRARAFLLGILLCIPVAWLCVIAPQSAFFSLPVAPISVLLGLVILNVPLRVWVPKWAFSQSDMLIIFAITSVCAAISGEWGRVGQPHTYMFALKGETDPTTRNFFLKYLPDTAVIKDPNVLRDLLSGGHDLGYVWSKLDLYLPKWLFWGGLTCSLMFGMLCINSLMRGTWTEKERLAFPLIQLPMAMAEKGGSGGMWRSRAMWIAFAIMFSIDILNGLNYLYPNLPSIPVKEYVDVQTLFKQPPLSNMGQFSIALYPFMAAIGIFMSSDLIFSVIVFFLLRKATHIMLASYGIPQDTFSGSAVMPGAPYFDEQSWGGLFALFLTTLWVSRAYLKEVWREIVHGGKSADAGVSHRFAFLGLIFSLAVGIGYGAYGGVPVWYMVPYIVAFFIFAIVLTRLRAQIGPPTHEFAYFGPASLMNRFAGTNAMSDAQATWLSTAFLFINRISRTLPMPYMLEAMKMGRVHNLRQKPIFWSIAVTIVVGFFLTYFFLQGTAYRTGQPGSSDAASYLNAMTTARHGPDLLGIGMTVLGFAIVIGLDAIRLRVPGFPLHPAGYVLAINFGVDYYWFGLLIALLVKNFVQRYYGLRGYDKLRSIALGILLGEYAAETIWMIMAAITKQSTYTISFNDRGLGAQ